VDVWKHEFIASERVPRSGELAHAGSSHFHVIAAEVVWIPTYLRQDFMPVNAGWHVPVWIDDHVGHPGAEHGRFVILLSYHGAGLESHDVIVQHVHPEISQ